jgi:CBS domain-containing protein
VSANPVTVPPQSPVRPDVLVELHLAELLTHPVLTVDVGESLWDAWQLMFVSGMHHLVVVRDGEAVAVLTDRALLADLPLTSEHLGRRRVAELVARGGEPRLRPEQSPSEAAVLLTTQGVEAAAVVDGVGRVLGIITLADIVAWVASGRPPTGRHDSR